MAVYDTCVQRADGRRMHFDILVPSELGDHAVILQYGRRYLEAKGVAPSSLKAEKCSYCHMESANPEVEQAIAETGFAIIEMEN